MSTNSNGNQQVEKQLIFVYNATADPASRMIGFAHKLISPQTYPCQICNLTWGAVKMRKDWEAFVSKIPFQVSFEYRDQWKAYQAFPLVILREDGEDRVLLSPEQINKMETLQDLIGLLTEELKI